MSAADPRKAFDILLETCKVESPIARKVPKLVVSQFSKMWGGLLEVALKEKTLRTWRHFLVFPKVILLTPIRGGSRLTKKKSLTSLIKARLDSWYTNMMSCGKRWSRGPLTGRTRQSARGVVLKTQRAGIAEGVGECRKTAHPRNPDRRT